MSKKYKAGQLITVGGALFRFTHAKMSDEPFRYQPDCCYVCRDNNKATRPCKLDRNYYHCLCCERTFKRYDGEMCDDIYPKFIRVINKEKYEKSIYSPCDQMQRSFLTNLLMSKS